MPDPWIGRRVSYHRRRADVAVQGEHTHRGRVHAIANETFYGRTVYEIANDDPHIGTEHVPIDRIIGAALDGMDNQPEAAVPTQRRHDQSSRRPAGGANQTRRPRTHTNPLAQEASP